ncbi:hypothetical protein Tco_0199415, partial [Tanacetum coccineum]
ADNMADENVPAPAPTRSNDQMLPFAVWVPIGKSNYFWNTLTYMEKAGTYRFQLEENWFTLDVNLPREALEITPIDQAHPFVSPPSGDAIMDFVNELGYPEVIHFVSSMAVNHLYQPWRAILSMINQCLTSKNSGHDRPRYPVLQMLWGIITSTNVDYAELMWEEFVQAMQTFLTDKANLGSPTKKDRKDKPHVIPYCRFTKLIIYHLVRIHNIHQRSASLFHLAEEDLRLGNLKFVSKGEVDEKVAAEKEGKKKTASAKQPKSKPATEKSSKPAPATKPKVTKEKPSNPSTAKPPKPKPAKEKSTKLVDEPDEEPAQPEPEPETEYRGESEEYDVERAIQMSKGKAIATDELAAQSLLALHTPKRRSNTDQFIFQRRTPATEEASTGPFTQPHDDTSANIVCDSPFPVDAKTSTDTDRTNSGGDTEILQFGDEQGDDVTAEVNLEDKTTEIDEGHARSDPGKTLESRPPPDDNKMDEDQAGTDPRESHVALAGLDPEPTHD